MNGSFVARLLFAVTVMVVALLLAPTASFAHAGHDHGATAIEASKQGPATHAVIEDVAEQSSESAIAKSQSVISSLPGTTGKSKIVCMGGCCTAASASCCAISLPILLGLLEPPP